MPTTMTIRGDLATADSPVLRGLSSADLDFEVAVIPDEVIVEGESSGVEVHDDASYDVYDPALVRTDAHLEVTQTAGPFGERPKFRSLNEDASIDDSHDGHVVYTGGEGSVEAIIGVSMGHGYRRREKAVRVPLSLLDDENSYQFIAYENGTMGHRFSSSLDTRIEGQNPASTKAVFATKDHATGTYVRNLSRVLGDVDMSCVSAWNSWQGTKFCLTLIGDDIAIGSHHVTHPDGTTERWVTNDNTIVERTVLSSVRIESFEQSTGRGLTDVRLYRLSSAMPESIKRCKIVPADPFPKTHFIHHGTSPVKQFGTGSNSIKHGEPVVWIDHNQNVCVGELWGSTVLTPYAFVLLFRQPTQADRLAFYKLPVSGDSGFGIFSLDDDELVIQSAWTTNNSGSKISWFMPQIEAAISDLGSISTLTKMDFSGFPTYE